VLLSSKRRLTTGCSGRRSVAAEPERWALSPHRSDEQTFSGHDTSMTTLHPYEINYRNQMNVFQKDLWTHLELTPTLPIDTGHAVLTYLLELACQSQNELNLELGRKALVALPRRWLLAYIEEDAEPLIQLNDEWEYRRLLELYSMLGDMLVRKLALRGIDNSDIGIREACRDFLESRDVTSNRPNI
jgi:hypothetical protein